MLFLYREVLGCDPGWLDGIVRAKRPQRLPVVLTRPAHRRSVRAFSGKEVVAMVSRAWLFGVLLVVPLVGFGVAEGIQAHFNSELRSVLRKQYPAANEDKLAQVTVDRLCEKSDPQTRELCDTNGNLNLMRRAALGAGGVGLALLLAIGLAGRLARNSRPLLVAVFRPGLYLTVVRPNTRLEPTPA